MKFFFKLFLVVISGMAVGSLVFKAYAMRELELEMKKNSVRYFLDYQAISVESPNVKSHAQIPPKKIKNFAIENKSLNLKQQIPKLWPTSGKITSLFGSRNHPIDKRVRFHSGIDIANAKSTDVLASATGIVEFAGKKGGYGNTIVIDHLNGFKTLYGHNNELLVEVGQEIPKGTLISRMGSTGKSTGPHLHFEILLDGKAVDPLKYLK